MAKDPAFLFMYRDWITTTSGWDADVRGWYINLLAHQADKPEGLTTDLESLAVLAGVKVSQYSRFCDCWNTILMYKFEVNGAGLLQETEQADHLEKRRRYKNKQEKWGIVGNFIKGLKQTHAFSEIQYKVLSKLLFNAIIELTGKEEIDKSLQQVLNSFISDPPPIEENPNNTLIAYPTVYPTADPERIIVNANEDVNEKENEIKKGGMGENNSAPLGMEKVKEVAATVWQDEGWKQSINYGHGLDKDSHQLKRWMSLFNARLSNDQMPNFSKSLYKKLFGGWLSMQISKGRKLTNPEVDVGQKPLEKLHI